jgi:diguanylate cyclase (GGDEF)-like protein/PAS domain S-box-containing protein
MSEGAEAAHPLLRRQLRRLGLDPQAVPDLPGWKAFVDRVSRAYGEADQDRYLMERSQSLASEEMATLNQALRHERDLLESRVAERTEALQRSEGRLASLVSLSSDWIWEQDTQGRLTYLSEGAMLTAGMPAATLLGRRAQELDGFECDDQTAQRYMQACAQHQPFRDVVHGVRIADGSLRFVSISGEPVFDAEGVFVGFRGVGTDVTAATLASRQLTLMARFDLLTGLPNRAQFIEELDRAVARARRAEGQFGLCFIDLDGFKQVNDLHGHAAGDEVLRATAARLLEELRQSDFVARLGGDEFVVMLNSGAHDIMRSAGERLIAEVAQVIPAGGQPITASAGAVAVGWGDVTWDDAYQAADVLLYEAKGAGKNQVVIGGLLGTRVQE